MIVMGGYGHSRLREFVLGGATRSILNTMTVPVRMSHRGLGASLMTLPLGLGL